MASLTEKFVTAAPPDTAALMGGSWVQTRFAMTVIENGKVVDDTTDFDERGLRVPYAAGYRWKLFFQKSPAGRLTVAQTFGRGPAGEPNRADVSPDGSVAFAEDVEADESVSFDCRAPDSEHLVCLHTEYRIDGVEFVRMRANSRRNVGKE